MLSYDKKLIVSHVQVINKVSVFAILDVAITKTNSARYNVAPTPKSKAHALARQSSRVGYQRRVK